MKVQDLCVCNAGACTPETSIARAGAIMDQYAVGSLPVLDREERVIGIVTDRDLLLETVRRNGLPSEIPVKTVMTDRPALASAEDDVLDCLAVMKRHRVRRLPVVDANGRLEGIISIDDILCHAADVRGDREISASLLVDALGRISRAYQAESGHPGLAREGTPTGGRRPSATERGRAGATRADEPVVRGHRTRPDPETGRRARRDRTR